MGWMDDPAYRTELEALDRIVADYVQARATGDDFLTQLLTGMMTAQLAAIYKLSPPAGLVDIPSLFVRDEG
jgi:hypothetical protein